MAALDSPLRARPRQQRPPLLVPPLTPPRCRRPGPAGGAPAPAAAPDALCVCCRKPGSESQQPGAGSSAGSSAQAMASVGCGSQPAERCSGSAPLGPPALGQGLWPQPPQQLRMAAKDGSSSMELSAVAERRAAGVRSGALGCDPAEHGASGILHLRRCCSRRTRRPRRNGPVPGSAFSWAASARQSAAKVWPPLPRSSAARIFRCGNSFVLKGGV